MLNACALVVIEDIIHGWLKMKLKPLTEGVLARAITALLAVVSVVMVLVIQKLGGVLGKFNLALFAWFDVTRNFYMHYSHPV